MNFVVMVVVAPVSSRRYPDANDIPTAFCPKRLIWNCRHPENRLSSTPKYKATRDTSTAILIMN
jgi:hypothetical protein